MNDLTELDKVAQCYAKAWCSQDPEKVAAFCWLMRSELVRFNASTLQRFSVRSPGNDPRPGSRERRGRKLGRRQTQTPQRRTSETQSRRSRLL